MLLAARIRVNSAWLGEKNSDGGGVRRFKKDGSGNLELNPDHVREQFRRAALNCGLPGKLAATLMIQPIFPPTIRLYDRRVTAVRQEQFESLRKGTQFGFEIFVDESRPAHPTEEQVDVLLRMIGQHFGLSPFGSKFGFGRFELLSLQCLPKPTAQSSTGETPLSTS